MLWKYGRTELPNESPKEGLTARSTGLLLMLDAASTTSLTTSGTLIQSRTAPSPSYTGGPACHTSSQGTAGFTCCPMALGASSERLIVFPSERSRLRDNLLELSLSLLVEGYGAGLSCSHESDIEGSLVTFSALFRAFASALAAVRPLLMFLIGQFQLGCRGSLRQDAVVGLAVPIVIRQLSSGVINFNFANVAQNRSETADSGAG